MINLSAKKQFQTIRKTDAEAFANIISTDAMRTALTYALAELATSGVTPEELIGAKLFMRILADLCETAEAQKIPNKDLKTFS